MCISISYFKCCKGQVVRVECLNNLDLYTKLGCWVYLMKIRRVEIYLNVFSIIVFQWIFL